MAATAATTATPAAPAKIPVTVLTGFLGSGKTTLLGRILNDGTHGKRLAVIENEYASQIGLGNELPTASKMPEFVAEIFETQGGCLCCSGRGDFIAIMLRLLAQRHRFDHIIVETTGLADPSFVNAFFVHPQLKDAVTLDAIVTLVDAQHTWSELNRVMAKRGDDGIEVINESIEQIAVADRIILNKIDLLPADAAARQQRLAELEQRVRSINPTADIMTASFSQVPLDRILDVRAFDVERVLRRDEGFLDFRPYRQHDSATGALSLVTPTASRVTAASDAAAVAKAAALAVDLDKFRQWLAATLEAANGSIFRVKGVLYAKQQPELKHIYQGVYRQFEVRPHTPWRADEERRCKLIFLGRNLDHRALIQSGSEALGVPLEVEVVGDVGPPPPMLRMLAFLVMMMIMFFPDDVRAKLASWPLADALVVIVDYRYIVLALYLFYTLYLSRVLWGPKRKTE